MDSAVLRSTRTRITVAAPHHTSQQAATWPPRYPVRALRVIDQPMVVQLLKLTLITAYATPTPSPRERTLWLLSRHGNRTSCCSTWISRGPRLLSKGVVGVLAAGALQCQSFLDAHRIDMAVTFVPKPARQCGKHEDGVGVSQTVKGGAHAGLGASQAEALGQGLGGDGLPPGTYPEGIGGSGIDEPAAQQRSTPLSDVPICTVDDRQRHLERALPPALSDDRDCDEGCGTQQLAVGDVSYGEAQNFHPPRAGGNRPIGDERIARCEMGAHPPQVFRRER